MHSKQQIFANYEVALGQCLAVTTASPGSLFAKDIAVLSRDYCATPIF